MSTCKGHRSQECTSQFWRLAETSWAASKLGVRASDASAAAATTRTL